MTALTIVAAAGFTIWAGSQWRTAHREHLTQPVGHRHDHKVVPGSQFIRCACGDVLTQWWPL